MTDGNDVREQQILDRYIQSSYGLWNALLTINGIILAATALVSSSSSLLANAAASALALMSIGLLTHNYVIVKRTYFRIGEVITGNAEGLTEKVKEKDIEVALSRNKRMQIFENVCLLILLLQAVIIIIGFVCRNA